MKCQGERERERELSEGTSTIILARWAHATVGARWIKSTQYDITEQKRPTTRVGGN